MLKRDLAYDFKFTFKVVASHTEVQKNQPNKSPMGHCELVSDAQKKKTLEIHFFP